MDNWEDRKSRSDPLHATALSRVTVGSLRDLGYVVDMAAAEAFVLPNLLQFAEKGLAAHAGASGEHAHALPIIPITLPEGSMQV